MNNIQKKLIIAVLLWVFFGFSGQYSFTASANSFVKVYATISTVVIGITALGFLIAALIESLD